jgi:hypothetical protein
VQITEKQRTTTTKSAMASVNGDVSFDSIPDAVEAFGQHA